MGPLRSWIEAKISLYLGERWDWLQTLKARFLTFSIQNASSVAIEQGAEQRELESVASINLRIVTELSSHPHILEVSVVSRKHAKWGERPMAFVILHPDYVLTWKERHVEFEKDLKAHAKQRLPGFACPEWVEVVSELPVSSFITL
jgi:hypothetical protein